MKDREKFPIPIGKKVRFTIDNLGASLRDALYASTGETYGPDDVGTVAFMHPNTKLCPDWAYVEVDSKAAPGEKRYVGVTQRMVLVLEPGPEPK